MRLSAFCLEEDMKKQKLKLNIIPPQKPSSKAEEDKRLVQFMDLLLSWHLAEQRGLNEKKV
jgi:hypothetical protein